MRETLEQALARSQRRRAVMLPFLVIAILAGVFGPLYLPGLHIASMRDLSMLGAFLLPFMLVMALGWGVSWLIARNSR